MRITFNIQQFSVKYQNMVNNLIILYDSIIEIYPRVSKITILNKGPDRGMRFAEAPVFEGL